MAKRKTKSKARPKPVDDDEPARDAEQVEGDGSDEPVARKAKKKAARKSGRKAGRKAASKPPEASPVEEPDEAEPAPAPKPRRARGAPIDLAQAVVQAAATNERLNQFLLEHLDERAWSMKPIDGRTIAAIVSHMHNVRHMWLAVSARDFPAPAKLDRRTVTLAQARTALAASGLAIGLLLERSLEAGGRVKDFRPDVVAFLAYLVAHDAHHRGQICMLARTLGMPLPKAAGYGMWDWNKRWQECGFTV